MVLIPHVEQNSQFTRYEVPELTLTNLDTLADLVAEFNHQEITPEKPLLSANLLNGERAQFVKAPACEKGKLICAIRRHGMRDMNLDDYVARGAFEELTQSNNTHLFDTDKKLLEYYRKRDYISFIRLAIKSRKNIIISGGTGTGKTTFLNACL
jgi:type IV secretion system protein VirB11